MANRRFNDVQSLLSKYKSFFVFSRLQIGSGVISWPGAQDQTIWNTPPTKEGTGDFQVSSSDRGIIRGQSNMFMAIMQASAGDDIYFQLENESSSATGFLTIIGTTKTDPADSDLLFYDWWSNTGNKAVSKFPLQSMEQGILCLPARYRANVGGAGNDPAFLSAQRGFTSIVRNAEGDYTLTLDQHYQEIIHAEFMGFDLSDNNDLVFQVHSRTTNSIRFLTHTGTTAADGAANMDVMVNLWLKNSTV